LPTSPPYALQTHLFSAEPEIRGSRKHLRHVEASGSPVPRSIKGASAGVRSVFLVWVFCAEVRVCYVSIPPNEFLSPSEGSPPFDYFQAGQPDTPVRLKPRAHCMAPFLLPTQSRYGPFRFVGRISKSHGICNDPPAPFPFASPLKPTPSTLRETEKPPPPCDLCLLPPPPTFRSFL